MSDERDRRRRPADRKEPVGAPVVRADPAVTGERAREAVGFDPDDPESLEEAAETVRAFASDTVGSNDNVYMLRGAAACAALVRGVGSYKAAAERAGGNASVAFIRKWARVHDLPQAIRRHVARGESRIVGDAGPDEGRRHTGPLAHRDVRVESVPDDQAVTGGTAEVVEHRVDRH